MWILARDLSYRRSYWIKDTPASNVRSRGAERAPEFPRWSPKLSQRVTLHGGRNGTPWSWATRAKEAASAETYVSCPQGSDNGSIRPDKFEGVVDVAVRDPQFSVSLTRALPQFAFNRSTEETLPSYSDVSYQGENQI